MPDFICRVAKAIKRSGKTTSAAIAIAVSRIKIWATGKGVDTDTQTKAATALAQWEKLRAKSTANNVKTSAPTDVSLHLTDTQLLALVALTPPCHQTGLDKVLLSITPRE